MLANNQTDAPRTTNDLGCTIHSAGWFNSWQIDRSRSELPIHCTPSQPNPFPRLENPSFAFGLHGLRVLDKKLEPIRFHRHHSRWCWDTSSLPSLIGGKLVRSVTQELQVGGEYRIPVLQSTLHMLPNDDRSPARSRCKRQPTPPTSAILAPITVGGHAASASTTSQCIVNAFIEDGDYL